MFKSFSWWQKEQTWTEKAVEALFRFASKESAVALFKSSPFCREVVTGPWWWRSTSHEVDWTNVLLALACLVLTSWVLKTTLRITRKVCAWFRKKPSLQIDPLMTQSESLVPGSQLMNGKALPKCQVRMACKRGETRMLMGGGVRVMDYLIVPTHVLHHGQGGVYMVTEEKEIKVPLNEAIDLAADVTAIAVTPSTWSVVGVNQAKLGPLCKTANVQVMSSCDLKFSVGTLSLGSTLGRVVYDASTQPGFSGSAYMDGNVCKGMHLHGGVVAGGYEMLYIYARLKHHLFMLGFIDEARGTLGSSDWSPHVDEKFQYEELEERIVSGKSERRAIVRTSTGHYHLTKAELLERVRNKDSTDWAAAVEAEDAERDLAAGNYIPEAAIIPGKGVCFPGEGQRPVARGPSGQAQSKPLPDSKSSNANQQRPPTKRELLTRKLLGQSNRQLEYFLSLLENGSKPEMATSSQIRPPQQSGPRSRLNSAV